MRQWLLLVVIALGIAFILADNTRVLLVAPLSPSPTTQQFSDLKLDLHVSQSSKPATAQPKADVTIDRGFELYRDRGSLNMRRGITVTLAGLPPSEVPSATAAERECVLFKSVFASKCVVLASGSASKNGGDGRPVHRLGMSLAFQESKPTPLFETAVRDRFRSVVRPISIVNWEATEPATARIAVYRTIEQACESYVEKGRDCSLLAGNINFTYGQAGLIAKGSVFLGYIQPTDR